MLLCHDPAWADVPHVQHIVIIVQENRTPDNLFHGLKNQLLLVDIADSGIGSSGQKIPLAPVGRNCSPPSFNRLIGASAA